MARRIRVIMGYEVPGTAEAGEGDNVADPGAMMTWISSEDCKSFANAFLVRIQVLPPKRQDYPGSGGADAGFIIFISKDK